MTTGNPDAVPQLPADMQAEIDAGTSAVIKQHSDTVLGKLDAEAGIAPAPEANPIEAAAAELEAAKGAKPAPKEPEKPAEEERSGKLAQQLRKLQVRLVQEQQTISRQKTEVADRESRVQKQLQEHQQVVAMARQDPLAWLQRFAGINREDLAARLLQNGAPRPEELYRQQNDETSRLRKEFDEYKAGVEKEKSDRELGIARENAIKVFVETARGNEERWPLASKWNEARLKAEGMRIAAESKKAGTPLDDESILDHIEEYLSEVATLRAPRSEGARPVPKSAGSTVKQSPPKPPAPTLTPGPVDGASDPSEPNADDVIALLQDKESFSRKMAAIARQAAKANGLKRTGIDT